MKSFYMNKLSSRENVQRERTQFVLRLNLLLF